jgi:hypothetical protein
MEFEPQDRKVVELLTKLKGANESYPSDMLAARRQAFLNTMAGAGLSVGTGSALNGTLKGGGGSGAASLTVGKVLEVALLVAIVAEAGTLAYFYRDKVADVFRSISEPSHVQEIASPPVATFTFPELEISKIPSSAVPTGTAPEMATSTSTQIPGVADDPTSNTNVDVSSTDSTSDPNVNTDSTPDPNVNNENNGNNGNHYGQTPRPERTKDNNDNQRPNDNHGNGNNH